MYSKQKEVDMRKYIYYFLALAFALASCSKGAKNEIKTGDVQKVSDASGEKLVVDTTLSAVRWTGFKPGGSHHGTLGIDNGDLYVEDNVLKSGTFTLDMNKIICEDLSDANMNAQLVGHLKSVDFFDVEKYPRGEFSITKVEELSEGADTLNIRISGNLSLKEIQKNITFDAIVRKEGELYVATTHPFSINRTEWGINYGSKNIFKDLKDSFIDDQIEIRLRIVAKFV